MVKPRAGIFFFSLPCFRWPTPVAPLPLCLPYRHYHHCYFHCSGFLRISEFPLSLLGRCLPALALPPDGKRWDWEATQVPASLPSAAAVVAVAVALPRLCWLKPPALAIGYARGSSGRRTEPSASVAAVPSPPETCSSWWGLACQSSPSSSPGRSFRWCCAQGRTSSQGTLKGLGTLRPSPLDGWLRCVLADSAWCHSCGHNTGTQKAFLCRFYAGRRGCVTWGCPLWKRCGCTVDSATPCCFGQPDVRRLTITFRPKLLFSISPWYERGGRYPSCCRAGEAHSQCRGGVASWWHWLPPKTHSLSSGQGTGGAL